MPPDFSAHPIDGRMFLKLYRTDFSGSEASVTCIAHLSLPTLGPTMDLVGVTIGPEVAAPSKIDGSASGGYGERPEHSRGVLLVDIFLSDTSDRSLKNHIAIVIDSHTLVQLASTAMGESSILDWELWGPPISRVFSKSTLVNDRIHARQFGQPFGYRIPSATPIKRLIRPRPDWAADAWLHRVGCLDFNPATVSWAIERGRRQLPPLAKVQVETTELPPSNIFTHVVRSSLPYYEVSFVDLMEVQELLLSFDWLVVPVSNFPYGLEMNLSDQRRACSLNSLSIIQPR